MSEAEANIVIRYLPHSDSDKAPWRATRGEHHAIGETPSAALALLELYLLEIESRERAAGS